MARHGSRGLSSYKYDALLALMAQSAAENNYAGFVSPEVGKEFINNVNAITAVNVGNGYGMLSGQGAIQHQGIGERIYQRDADLFANAAKQGLRVSYQSSGEPRATESGENFKLGFDQASNGLLANAVVAPNNLRITIPARISTRTPPRCISIRLIIRMVRRKRARPRSARNVTSSSSRMMGASPKLRKT